MNEVAGRLAREAWAAASRVAVVTCTLRRPGRGRSAAGSNRGGWRQEERRAVLVRLDEITAQVVRGLTAGTLSPAEARTRVANAGFADAVRIAITVEELAVVLDEVMRAGDNIWVDCSPDGRGVIYLRWASDPSHPKFL